MALGRLLPVENLVGALEAQVLDRQVIYAWGGWVRVLILERNVLIFVEVQRFNIRFVGVWFPGDRPLVVSGPTLTALEPPLDFGG